MILTKYNETILNSSLYKQTINLIGGDITGIRCLALGSLEDKISLYQLSYLYNISTKLNAPVSIYDPVFTDRDIQKLEDMGMTVSESYIPKGQVLYFLPHAPLDVTETLMKQYKPKYLLANHLMRHTERLTKSKLHSQYPYLSHLVNLVDDTPDLEFITVGRRRKVKMEVVYDYGEYYFDGVEVRGLDTEGVWGNAFSDLALHIVHSKSSGMNVKSDNKGPEPELEPEPEPEPEPKPEPEPEPEPELEPEQSKDEGELKNKEIKITKLKET